MQWKSSIERSKKSMYDVCTLKFHLHRPEPFSSVKHWRQWWEIVTALENSVQFGLKHSELFLVLVLLRLTAELESAVRPRKSFAKKSCNKSTTPLKYTSFAIRAISLDRQTVPTLSCRENIPTNEMQFTDRISLLRSVRSVRIDKPYMTTVSMKKF